MKGIVYLDMLQEFLIPQLEEDDQERRIHFQQDGTPPHYLGEEREYLNTCFSVRWIGRERQTDRQREIQGVKGNSPGAKAPEFKNFSNFRVKAHDFKFEFEAVGEGVWAHPGF
jgi:hypothetical protein